jgi:hypothetical protein
MGVVHDSQDGIRQAGGVLGLAVANRRHEATLSSLLAKL